MADLHGTIMYSWACAILIELLADFYPSESKK